MIGAFPAAGFRVFRFKVNFRFGGEIVLKKVFCESVLVLLHWFVSVHVACFVGVHPILIFIFLQCVTGVRFREKGLGSFFKKSRLTRKSRNM